jgi:site-specific DNA recombinase
MYGNKSIKKRKDGSNYKDFYYYGCKHRNMTRGHKCDYKKQVHEEMLDASVAEVISKLVSNPKFSDLIRNKINMEVDTSALDQEIENYKIQLRKLYHNKDTILSDMDSLDYEDKHYQRRKTDLENHLYKTYDKIDDAEELLVSAKAKKRSLLADKITGDNIYKALVFFDKLYAQMNEAEKREFLSQLVDNVQIYEERKENGQWLKSIEFKLPIIEKEFTLSLDNDTQNETVVMLSNKKPDSVINVKVEFGEGEGKVPLDNIAKRAEAYKPKERVTYKRTKEYIEAKYGFKVHTAYIAEVKRDLGLPMYDAPNAVEELKQPRKHPTPEKVEAIKDALKHFELI